MDIVIGDVHGCLDEMNELLYECSYRPDRDRLVFVGDLVDRGPYSNLVIKRVRKLNAICVMGNHDEWYVRYAKHAEVERTTGKPNPMKVWGSREEILRGLSPDDLQWLASLPLYYRLDEKTVVIHAGMTPGIPVEHQPARNLLRMRYLRRSNGEMWNMASDELLTPDVAAFWTEVWCGPDEVIYGHHPSKTDTVITENAGVRCWGIDTGCCFGNKLTAWVRHEGQIDLLSVPAHEPYADWHRYKENQQLEDSDKF